jgi:predicted dehydrogenase
VAIDLLGEVEKVFAWIGAREVLPGLPIDAPAIVAWRYKGDKDIFGILDLVMSNELEIDSKYYAADERMEVTGEKGVVWVMKCTADMLKVPPVIMYKDGKITKFDVPRDDWGDSFHDSTHHFIDAIKNDTEPVLTGAKGREVLKFSLAMMRSARESREVYLNELEV